MYKLIAVLSIISSSLSFPKDELKSLAQSKILQFTIMNFIKILVINDQIYKSVAHIPEEFKEFNRKVIKYYRVRHKHQ